MRIYIIKVYMEANFNSRKEISYCGLIGRFTSLEKFEEAYDRANKNVIPRLNDWADDYYQFYLVTEFENADSYNDDWETVPVEELLG